MDFYKDVVVPNAIVCTGYVLNIYIYILSTSNIENIGDWNYEECDFVLNKMKLSYTHFKLLYLSHAIFKVFLIF